MASWVATLILDLATGIFKALGGDLEAYMAEKQREAANAKAVNDALQKKDQSGIETAIGNPNAGDPSGLPGTELRDSLPGVPK